MSRWYMLVPVYIWGTLPRVPNFSLWKSHMNVIVIIYIYLLIYIVITYMKIGKPNTNSFPIAALKAPHSVGFVECKDHIRCHCWMASSSFRRFSQRKNIWKKHTSFFLKKKQAKGRRSCSRKLVYQIFSKISKGLNVCGGMSSYRLQLICFFPNLDTLGASSRCQPVLELWELGSCGNSWCVYMHSEL